ncbi:MAG TPA: agmatinase [Bacteroidales bacterium]|nr:agmatinase [Bacteroidales bacterium]
MNFGGTEIISDYETSGIVIIPVPYDETSTWMKGSDRGPDAILEASQNLEFYDIETESEVCRKGIFTDNHITEKGTPEALAGAVYEKAVSVLNDNKFPVFIGGNHTVSIGAARAFSERYQDLTVLQLDAHADLRQEYEGSPFNHACTMARIREMAPVIQVGIRSISADELPYADRDRIFPAHSLFHEKALYGKALDLMSEKIYITIDLDVLDPSLMPSTGTPEPGGPEYFELMHFLREVARKRNVVGFDVVELCPSPSNKAPDFIAAKIIYQLLSYIFI